MIEIFIQKEHIDRNEILDEIEKSKKDFYAKTAALDKGKKNAFSALKWNEDSSLSGTIDKTKSALGLDYLGKGGSGNSGGSDKEKLKKAAQQKSDSIASGGNKMTTITININKLQDQTVINVDKTETGLNNLGDKVQEILLRAVNSANQMQTG